MPEKDPTHWLYRLTSDEWLRAGAYELFQSRRAFSQKSQREGVVYARRAAGMSVNALLWHQPNDSYGRSYMDHLVQLGKDSSVPELIRLSAEALIAMPIKDTLVTIGKQGDPSRAEPAANIYEWAKKQVAHQLRSA